MERKIYYSLYYRQWYFPRSEGGRKTKPQDPDLKELATLISLKNIFFIMNLEMLRTIKNSVGIESRKTVEVTGYFSIGRSSRCER